MKRTVRLPPVLPPGPALRGVPRDWVGPVVVIATVAIVVAVMLALEACRPVVRSPRAEARAAILAVANGVVVADAWCAAAAMRTRDVRLAETCTEEYTTARGALLQAEDALNDGEMVRAGCEAAPALVALASMARRPTGRLPPGLEDALIMSAEVAKNLPCKGDAAR